MLDFLRHLLLPHQSNNHRARVLHVDALFVYVLLFVLVHLSIRAIHRQYPDILGYATDIRVDQLFSDVNVKRTQSGLTPLVLSGALSAAAAAKANDMFAKGYWAHVAPDGKTPWDFIVGAGYKYTVAGENLAKNFSTSQAVVDAWMASTSHRDNILKPQYRDIGFAVVNGVLNGEETTLVVQMFGASGAQLAAAPPVTQTTPAPAREVAIGPTPLPVQELAKPIVLPEYASVNEAPVKEFFASFKQPLVDIPQATRTLVFVFVGFMLGVLAVDAWLAARHRVVRVAGHNVAHFLFLIALLIATGAALPGSVL